MNAGQLIALLGKHADDTVVESAFVELQTRRRPELDPEDRDVMRDWVLIRKKGVELGFIDEIFFQAGEARRRRRKGVPLLLYQVYFYTKRDDIATFTGDLPFGLKWSDNRDQARRKLVQYESTRRSYTKDTWDVPGYRITVDYKKDVSSIDSIVCQLIIKPWPEEGRIQLSIGISDWLSLLGHPATSSALRRHLQPLDLAKQIRDGENDRDIDFTMECGLKLYFTEFTNLKRIKRQPLIKRTDLVLGVVQFFRRRELDSREWIGEMPFRLSFEDTQQIMMDKVGQPPNEQDDDYFSGVCRWDFHVFSLEVLYNNIENNLLRVTLMAPGF